MKNMPITKNPPGGAFLKGGNNKMHSWSGSGKQEPGQSAQEGTGGKRDMGPHAGSSGVMGFSDGSKKGREMTQKHGTNASYAGPQTAGHSSQEPSGGDKNGFAKGGSTSMHGNTGSRPAQPGCSSQQ